MFFNRLIQVVREAVRWRAKSSPSRIDARVWERAQRPRSIYGYDLVSLDELDDDSAPPTLAAATIEFVGGPLDGYEEWLTVPTDELAHLILIPVSQMRLNALYDGTTAWHNEWEEPTTIAFYELRRSMYLAPRYCFVGIDRPENAPQR